MTKVYDPRDLKEDTAKPCGYTVNFTHGSARPMFYFVFI